MVISPLSGLMEITSPPKVRNEPETTCSATIFDAASSLVPSTRSWSPTSIALKGATCESENFTEPSAMSLVVLVTLVCASRFWPVLRTATRTAMGDRPEWTYARNAKLLVRGMVVSPWVWAFVWAMVELSMAFSPSTSTLLLVTYFAATAVASVAVGRWRNSARLRQIGLALAVAAAATAVYGASTYFNSGIRIVAYLVTSAFLLGIAYWYRQPGTSTASA